jgi:hypothetical protein
MQYNRSNVVGEFSREFHSLSRETPRLSLGLRGALVEQQQEHIISVSTALIHLFSLLTFSASSTLCAAPDNVKINITLLPCTVVPYVGCPNPCYVTADCVRICHPIACTTNWVPTSPKASSAQNNIPNIN